MKVLYALCSLLPLFLSVVFSNAEVDVVATGTSWKGAGTDRQVAEMASAIQKVGTSDAPVLSLEVLAWSPYAVLQKDFRYLGESVLVLANVKGLDGESSTFRLAVLYRTCDSPTAHGRWSPRYLPSDFYDLARDYTVSPSEAEIVDFIESSTFASFSFSSARILKIFLFRNSEALRLALIRGRSAKEKEDLNRRVIREGLWRYGYRHVSSSEQTVPNGSEAPRDRPAIGAIGVSP